MNIRDAFEQAHEAGHRFEFTAATPFTLDVRTTGISNEGRQYYLMNTTYCFLTRQAVIQKGDHTRILMFSEMDAEVLDAMRSLLIERGGKPPALAATPPARPSLEKTSTPAR